MLSRMHPPMAREYFCIRMIREMARLVQRCGVVSWLWSCRVPPIQVSGVTVYVPALVGIARGTGFGILR
jgi:hypothetical protein